MRLSLIIEGDELNLRPGCTLDVPHFMPGWEAYQIRVLDVWPARWGAAWVWGLDQAGCGVQVYVSAPVRDGHGSAPATR